MMSVRLNLRCKHIYKPIHIPASSKIYHGTSDAQKRAKKSTFFFWQICQHCSQQRRDEQSNQPGSLSADLQCGFDPAKFWTSVRLTESTTDNLNVHWHLYNACLHLSLPTSSVNPQRCDYLPGVFVCLKSSPGSTVAEKECVEKESGRNSE